MQFDKSPILLFWETTRACQLACRHCRASAIAEPLPGQLTTGEARRFLDTLPAFGRSPVLILTGGDPFMRADIFDLAAHARDLGTPIAFAPSVTPLVTADRLAKMKAVGAKSVSISLDGARAETHERIRGVPGHFERTLATLRHLVSEGFSVQVNTTIMRDNVEELPDVAALLSSIGVHIWEAFFLVKVGRGTGLQDLTPAEGEDVVHFLYDASCYGLVVRTVEAPFFRRVAVWRREAGPDADPAERFVLGPLYRSLRDRLRAQLGGPVSSPRVTTAGTRDGKGILFVAHDGDVYPAGFFPFRLGNVRDGNVVDIYRDHPLLKSIRGAEFSGRCGICEFKDLCGGSRSRAYAMLGDPLGEDPACVYEPRVRLEAATGGVSAS